MDNKTALAQGNQALREKKFAHAVAFYLQALEATPGLSKIIAANLAIARRNYKEEGNATGRLRVAVCGWELSHNAAGRSYTLAKLYETFADVEIIGCILSKYGKDLWKPIQGTATPVHCFVVEQETHFLEQALALVVAHPYDVVHLSKPRAPNIFIGVLYKLLWGARVIVDIDDEELCFVGFDDAISLDDYLKAHRRLPPQKNLDGPDWTRLAVGLARVFDGVTVSNPALQKKYGGEIVRHARDEGLFKPSPQRKRESREALGIPECKKVVLFFGTPRTHKGLLETADAIRSLDRNDVVFAIVGDFQGSALKEQLLKKTGVDYYFLGSRPFDKIPDVVAAGDYCVLLQDPGSPVAQFQVPAKLSDALGMGLVVFASDLPPLSDLAAQGALVTVTRDGLARALAEAIQDESLTRRARASALAAFATELSFAANAPRLRTALRAGDGKAAGDAGAANQFGMLLDGTRLSFLLGLLDGNKPRSPSHSKGKQSSVLTTSAERVDIVIPVFNALEDVKKCLHSLQEHKDGFLVKAIVVNDGSDDATTAWLRNFCVQDPMFKLIEHENNQGYTTAVNSGLKASEAPYVITQNSDTIVTHGWLRGLIRCISSESKIGIAGPLSNAASWQNVPDLYDATGGFAVNVLPAGTSADDMAQIVAASSKRSYPRLPFVNGFCFMIKREVINAVGFMDEENFPVGYGEENDFCIRAADAGFDLAIADDAYVFHAKSKSFGHERRKELSRQGSDALKRKHTPAKFGALVDQVKQTAELDRIRSDIKAKLVSSRRPVGMESIDITSMRILFLLPVWGLGGGVHSVVQETVAMRRLGITAEVAVRNQDIPGYREAYSDMPGVDTLFTGFDETNLVDVAEKFDIVIATIYHSIILLKTITDCNQHILPAYYVQDYEPLFFEPGSDNWKLARMSYTLIPHAVLFAKTHWIARTVVREHGVAVHKVLPSIDHDVYKVKAKPRDGIIRIAAMIRPQTPRRGAERTMRLLSRLMKANPGKLAIDLFGCSGTSPLFQQLPSDYDFKNHGELKRQKVAEVLAGADIFVDLSDYQAFGRTGLEAMACGCTAMLPIHGGVDEYALDNINSIIVDSLDPEECFARLQVLVEFPETIFRMKLAALQAAARYSPHSAAISELTLLAKELSRHRVEFPYQERQTAFVLMSYRKDGMPTDSAYARLLLPYKVTDVRKHWHLDVWTQKTLPVPGSAPVVLLQSEVSGWSIEKLSRWLPSWRAAGGKLVYEIDEDLLDADVLRNRHFQGDVDALAGKAKWLAANADLVSVSTQPLAEIIKPINCNVRVVPDYLHAQLWKLTGTRDHTTGPFPRQPQGPIRIGYFGTRMHNQDLGIVTEAMRRIEKFYAGKVEIEVIGAFEDSPPIFGKKVSLPKSNNYPNFVNWLHRRVHWEIGILPLVDDSFNRCKGHMKFLEYAALDMAIVCSNVPGYRDVAIDGMNALVVDNTTVAWESAISKLIEDSDFRNLLAANARESVAKRHTLDDAMARMSLFS
jgi:GT2 family glycosyltransferase/glycosyltransferase involved in cell wall biosynthesis